MRPRARCGIGALLCVLLSGCGTQPTVTATAGATAPTEPGAESSQGRERAAERSGGASERRGASDDRPVGKGVGKGTAKGNPWHGVDRLQRSRATFAEHGDHYRFKLRSSCGEPGVRYTVTVRRGAVIDVVAPPSATTARTPSAPSIEQLFDELALAAGRAAGPAADRVDVAFSPRGYPRKISIDPDAARTGDEVCYHVHGLHFLSTGRG